MLLSWVVFRALWVSWGVADSAADRDPLGEGLYDVVRVVDGDTLIVRPRTPRRGGPTDTGHLSLRPVRVRLLGIDAPESVRPNYPVQRWGPEASARLGRLVRGQPVRLRFDRRRLDKYDRYLAYVYVEDLLVNEALVRAGLARVLVFPGDSESMARRLRAAQREAQRLGRGMWSDQATLPVNIE